MLQPGVWEDSRFLEGRLRLQERRVCLAKNDFGFWLTFHDDDIPMTIRKG